MKLNENHANDIDELLRHALKDIRLGSIDIVIHDRKFVQIERQEKFRLNHTSTQTSPASTAMITSHRCRRSR